MNHLLAAKELRTDTVALWEKCVAESCLGLSLLCLDA